MNKYGELRKISQVFRNYGIVLTGGRKYDHFVRDLRMDRIFVSGLIFELEYELQREIDEEKLEEIHAPAQVIALLIA
ncbi:acyl carrier protein [Algoriphagus sp. H41]|uniref:Acyl carrier protein n=1 Tax=Algoriphagus oliviformis TaxID=2811231 RepID=A0ABS3C9A2_9BACT|nr:acyl carrier protein [Algoriphagus oliviformis]MBN7813697.1 acyl carrier protein [Algoriphagus oliviformis]